MTDLCYTDSIYLFLRGCFYALGSLIEVTFLFKVKCHISTIDKLEL